VELREFSATHWSVVLHAGRDDSPAAAEAMERLCSRYWYPLYVYVRRQGVSPPEAQDITQGFFQQFIARDSLRAVDRAKGKFRSFLLASMKNFLLNAWRDANRLKRGGAMVPLVYDDGLAEARFLEDGNSQATPEQALDRTWATTLMEVALQALEDEYRARGKGEQFEALKPFLSTVPEEGEYLKLGRELGLSKNSVGVAVHRLRQRYGELIREEVAHTVTHPLEVEEEVRYLFKVLTGGP
jgi:RNA polymerase sigma-70 factor (ECF subfamily)